MDHQLGLPPNRDVAPGLDRLALGTVVTHGLLAAG
jgi:hypothetical protein